MQPDAINIPAYQRIKTIKKKSKSSATKIRSHKRLLSPIEELDIHSKSQIPEIQNIEIACDTIREYKETGHIEGYFERINVAIIKLTAPLKIGDIILLEKNGGLFEQEISSMQIDGKEVRIARTGEIIGLKVSTKVNLGGKAYRIR